MRRLMLLIILLITVSSAEAFDEKGLQPLSPFGIFSTFSAETLKQNQVGFELGAEKSVDPNFYRAFFQFAYGLHDRFEIDMTLPYVLGYQNGAYGMEDFNLGIKHRILDEGTYTPAIAYMLTVSAPSGRDEFSTNGSVGGGLILTEKIGPFKGHLNALYSKPQEEGLKPEYLLNMGAELAITHDSKFLTELVGRKNYYKPTLDLLEWRVGYRIATTDNIFTTIGAGFNIKERAPALRLMFSVSIILPKEKKPVEKIYEE